MLTVNSLTDIKEAPRVADHNYIIAPRRIYFPSRESPMFALTTLFFSSLIDLVDPLFYDDW